MLWVSPVVFSQRKVAGNLQRETSRSDESPRLAPFYVKQLYSEGGSPHQTSEAWECLEVPQVELSLLDLLLLWLDHG